MSEMSSETQTAESSDATAPAPETSEHENVAPATNDAPEPASLPVKVEDTSSADPPAAENAPVSTATPAGKQYPKLNLRVNEFGIYELDTDQEGTQSLIAALTKVEPMDEKPETVLETNEPSAATTISADSASASSVPVEASDGIEASNGSTSVAVSATSSTTISTTTTATSSSGNSERERWKQRFPTNAMAKADIIGCKQCDGYGIADDFVDADFCSERCRKIGLKPRKAGKVGGKRKSTSSNTSNQVAESNVVESSIDSCDSSKEGETKSMKSLTSTSWSWSKYLEKRRAQAAPERLFTDPFPYGKHGFRVGMKLEGIDPEHQSLFCVLTVAEVQGYRLRLHFDGYSDSYDFWVNADSENIFPCGWCEKNGQKLRPPKNWELPSAQASPSQNQGARTFSWPQYLKFTSSVAAPRQLFTSTRNEYPVPSAFRIKMKLEAVDRRHAAHTLCVATVANVIGNRFLVHFDEWDDIYDYWADPSCPYVHPIGWAQEHGTSLTPPCDFEEMSEEFTWDNYLARTGATAVPPRAFKPRSPVGFKVGMKLECVDPRNPQLIRVATIAAVKGYRVKIHFDGWSSDFDLWTDDDWPDLHPPGWCAKTGHVLQPPLMPTNGSIAKDSGCPTPGCTGVGHVEGARYASHTSVETCPYSGKNLHRDSPAIPDRLAGEELDSVPGTLSTSTVEPASLKEENTRASRSRINPKQEPETKELRDDSVSPVPSQKLEPEAKRTKLSPSIELSVKVEPEAESTKASETDSRAESPAAEQNYDSTEASTPPPKKPRMSFFTGKIAANDRDKRKSVQNEDKLETDNDQNASDRKSEKTKIVNEVVETAVPTKRPELDLHTPTNSSLTTPLCWSKHSALLADFVGNCSSVQACQWTCDQVLEFLGKFGLNSLLLERFKLEEIDGEALLSLSQSDLTDLLGVKLGPAIKIRNALLLMRERARTKAN